MISFNLSIKIGLGLITASLLLIQLDLQQIPIKYFIQGFLFGIGLVFLVKGFLKKRLQ